MNGRVAKAIRKEYYGEGEFRQEKYKTAPNGMVTNVYRLGYRKLKKAKNK